MKIVDILKGMLIGVSNIIPGVSGGTMAVVLGIYEKLLDSINDLKSDFKNSFIYLFKIGIGAILGVILFSNVISFFLDKYPIRTNYLFAGLVVGSFGMISEKVTDKRISIKSIISVALGFIVVYGISYLGESMGMSNGGELTRDMTTMLMLGVAGFIAAATMILPGVSGSLTLVMLGLYDKLVLAVSTLDIVMLIPVAIGAILGIFSMSRVIAYLIKKYNDISYRFIIGLVVASIIIILQSNPITGGIMPPFICFMLGCIITKTLGNYSKIKESKNVVSCQE